MEEKKNEQRELGRDEVFAEVKEVIESVEKSRMVAEAGSKHGLKRNPYQTLKEKGLMNPDFILSEFDKIQAKASNLSSGERGVISKIMMMALHNAAVKEYRHQEIITKAKEYNIPDYIIDKLEIKEDQNLDILFKRLREDLISDIPHESEWTDEIEEKIKADAKAFVESLN